MKPVALNNLKFRGQRLRSHTGAQQRKPQHYAAFSRFQRYSRKVIHPCQTLAALLAVLGTSRWYLHWLQGLCFCLCVCVCVYVWKFLAFEEFHWVCFRFGLGSLRCFKFEWDSRRMCKSKRQCGKHSMSLRLRRFMPCAPTSVGFSWRYLKFYILISNWYFLVSCAAEFEFMARELSDGNGFWPICFPSWYMSCFLCFSFLFIVKFTNSVSWFLLLRILVICG